MTEIETIAKGLAKAQREILPRGPEQVMFWVMLATVAVLVVGLIVAFGGSQSIAVRDYLKAQEERDEG